MGKHSKVDQFGDGDKDRRISPETIEKAKQPPAEKPKDDKPEGKGK
jgi:hypothetical protein